MTPGQDVRTARTQPRASAPGQPHRGHEALARPQFTAAQGSPVTKDSTSPTCPTVPTHSHICTPALAPPASWRQCFGHYLALNVPIGQAPETPPLRFLLPISFPQINNVHLKEEKGEDLLLRGKGGRRTLVPHRQASRTVSVEWGLGQRGVGPGPGVHAHSPVYTGPLRKSQPPRLRPRAEPRCVQDGP